MEEILYMQKNAPRPVTARRFVMSAAGVVLRLAVAQIIVNMAIAATGAGLLNVLFYLYAVALLAGYMRGAVAGSAYVLGESVLTLQSLLGDSTSAVVEVPLASVVALRPVRYGENLRLCYAQVTAVDAAAKPGWRMRAAFAASLVSARLARLIAGKRAMERAGWAAVFAEEGHLRACVFRPDEKMLDALAGALPDAFDVDDRMTRAKVRTIYARALARAFPQAYPHVEPLVDQRQIDWANEELARRKQARAKAREDEKRLRGMREAARQRKKDRNADAGERPHRRHGERKENPVSEAAGNAQEEDGQQRTGARPVETPEQPTEQGTEAHHAIHDDSL